MGHVPDTLVCVLAPILDVGQLMHMEGTITWVPRSAPEVVHVPRGVIEIPFKCILLGLRKDHDNIRQILQEVRKSTVSKAED